MKDLGEASSPEEAMPMCGADDKEMQCDYFSVASYWPSFGAGRQMNASCKHEHWAPSAPFCQEASPETDSIFTSDPSQLTPLSVEDSPIKHFQQITNENLGKKCKRQEIQEIVAFPV